jgi:hypothetical protein
MSGRLLQLWAQLEADKKSEAAFARRDGRSQPRTSSIDEDCGRIRARSRLGNGGAKSGARRRLLTEISFADRTCRPYAARAPAPLLLSSAGALVSAILAARMTLLAMEFYAHPSRPPPLF